MSRLAAIEERAKNEQQKDKRQNAALRYRSSRGERYENISKN